MLCVGVSVWVPHPYISIKDLGASIPLPVLLTALWNLATVCPQNLQARLPVPSPAEASEPGSSSRGLAGSAGRSRALRAWRRASRASWPRERSRRLRVSERLRLLSLRSRLSARRASFSRSRRPRSSASRPAAKRHRSRDLASKDGGATGSAGRVLAVSAQNRSGFVAPSPFEMPTALQYILTRHA